MNKAVINNALNEVDHITEYMIDRTREFEVIDWAVFKICLVSLGMLIGMHFTRVRKVLSSLLVVVYLSSLVYIMWRIFFPDEN